LEQAVRGGPCVPFVPETSAPEPLHYDVKSEENYPDKENDEGKKEHEN